MIPIFSKIANTTNATVKIITISGLTFTPRVSSSKNRSRPALCIGIGAFFSRFFFRLLLINDDPRLGSFGYKLEGYPLIKVMSIPKVLFLLRLI